MMEPQPPQLPSRRVYIVGCGATKQPHKQMAMHLYTGPLFKASLNYALSHMTPHRDTTLILSAKHGLLPLDRVIEPYDTTWSDEDAVDRRYLSRQIEGRDWSGVSGNEARFVFLCGWPYAKRLLDAYFHAHGHEAVFEAPLSGLGIGQRIKWLKEAAKETRQNA